MGIKITIPNTSSDTLTFGSANTTTAAQIAGIDSGSTNGQLAIYTTASGTSTERVRVDASGNVGIGTSSPAYKLDVSQTSGDVAARVFANATTTSSRLEITNGDGTTAINYSYIRFINNKTSSQDWRFGTYGNNNLSFVNLTAGTTPMTLDTSGNLLVGRTTNTAGTRLNVLGINPVNAETSTATGTCYQGTYSNTTGIVYFGNWSYNGVGVGNINSTGTTTSYVTTSDYRLKENVQPMTGALAKVSQLNPVTYNWKSNGSTGQGFIAHELQEIVPECVSGEKDAVDADGNPIYQGIDTSFLVATLTAAIKEQQALIQQLTDRITALENK